jgi:hypothetical protein
VERLLTLFGTEFLKQEGNRVNGGRLDLCYLGFTPVAIPGLGWFALKLGGRCLPAHDGHGDGFLMDGQTEVMHDLFMGVRFLLLLLTQALPKSGIHLMAYLGRSPLDRSGPRSWPSDHGHGTIQGQPWFQSPMNIVRWSVLQ